MRPSVSLCAFLILGLDVGAQTIALNGTVKSDAGSPISGATVALDSKSLKATTDASGGYSLTGGTNGILDRSDLPGSLSMVG
ncbi:MAG TPA: carboxypeptidase-like regulatory domain-containing protein, partial [Fibrobacteria bacterium]|nr:carboxypeptidase-like regulatory domain-containing protein [Fibrobacteria bacterium]